MWVDALVLGYRSVLTETFFSGWYGKLNFSADLGLIFSWHMSLNLDIVRGVIQFRHTKVTSGHEIPRLDLVSEVTIDGYIKWAVTSDESLCMNYWWNMIIILRLCVVRLNRFQMSMLSLSWSRLGVFCLQRNLTSSQNVVFFSLTTFVIITVLAILIVITIFIKITISRDIMRVIIMMTWVIRMIILIIVLVVIIKIIIIRIKQVRIIRIM